MYSRRSVKISLHSTSSRKLIRAVLLQEPERADRREDHMRVAAEKRFPVSGPVFTGEGDEPVEGSIRCLVFDRSGRGSA